MTMRRRRVIAFGRDARLLSGFYTLDDGQVTVTSEHGTKSVPLGGSSELEMARMLLRELAADRDKDR
jgi:hypothetical protein